MTDTATPTRRHRWTKEEISHLKRVVSHAKTKKHGFELVAEEMGLPYGTVSAQYANIMRKGIKPVAKRGPGRPRKDDAQRSWAQANTATVASTPAQIGRPFDFTSYSERELIEMGEALKFEVSRRREALGELEGFFGA